MIHELNSKRVKKINDFLKDNNADYMQGIKWNIIRNEEKKYYLYFEDDNKILWVCNLLEKTKGSKKYLYAPRGPVLCDNNLELINHFLENIKSWMKEKGYYTLIINPYLKYTDLSYISSKYKYSITKNNDYANLLDSCKLAIMDIIYDEEELINKLPSKFRQNTRRSYRHGLKRKVSKNVNVDVFYELYVQTSIRHDFKPHTKEYFYKLIDTYKKDLIFLEVWYKDIPLAMSIDIINNDKLIYLYGVSSTENRNLLGMYNLQWEAIKYCIKKHIPKYDFGGVFCEEDDINNKDMGLYNFKKGYCYNGFIDVVPDLTFDFRG